jgi:hypothetical protein
MKRALTFFPGVQSRADGTFYVPVYILCSDELLKEFERRFQERDVSESAELIYSVLKEN